jgi:hypothetical protein
LRADTSIPRGQVQTPAVHVVPVAHGRLQPPQLAGSVIVSTQAVPHSFVPPEHVVAQTLEEQACPVGQATPHAPQLAASFLVFTQAEPHKVVPPAH